MKRFFLASSTALSVVALGLAAGPAQAANGYPNWGQEVKDCNQSSCYPDGTSRGAYVRDQARDGEGPGYAYEIHTFANPGKAGPW